ncbi:MAG: LCP family protein [candidate division SR1 bacterium]|nr:LCP family protein [candidate division SR1 bacterium]
MPTSFKSTAENMKGFENDLLRENINDNESNFTIIDIDTVKIKPNKIDTDNSEIKENKPKKSRFSMSKISSVFILLISIILIGSFIFAYSMISNSNNYLGNSQNTDFFSQLGQIGSILNISKRTQLKGEEEGRTNFLLIGKDATGVGLTDTLMVASYFYKEQKITTFNIPRDFVYADSQSGGSGKINGLYTLAEEMKTGDGERYLAEFFGKEFGITIHYWSSINFDGVREIVDAVGGIDINVDNEFTDCNYPKDDYSGLIRPCPTFKTGNQKMDGKTALIYARSRYSESIEGGDFARGRRQSIVVKSLLDKIKSQNLFENATKITTYLNIINKNFKTSLKLDELAAFGQILKDNPNIKDNYITNVWQVGNGFICERSTPTISQNGYCDGAFLGGSGSSVSRNKARNFVQNILQSSVLGVLLEAKVIVLGNQSFDTDKIYNDIISLGFTDINLNNNYSKIKSATVTSIETVKIYITDPKIKELFDKLDKKPQTKYEILTKIPEDIVIPTTYKDAKVIIWVS